MIAMPDLLEYWAKFRPDKEVVVCGEDRWTWDRFIRAARSVAADLQQRGIAPGERVGVLLPNCAQWAVAYAGLTLAGAVLVPLNARFGRFELRAIEEDADCAAIVTTGQVGKDLADRFALGEGEDIVIASRTGGAAPSDLTSVIAGGARHVPLEIEPDALAAIFYTSGSTGLPKGTMQTHATIAAYVFGYDFALQFTSEDKTLIVAPLAFTGACLSLMIPMMAIGACSYIEPTLDPARVLHAIEHERISFITQVPAIWDRLAAMPQFAATDLSSLRIAMTGGAPVPVSLLEVYRAKGVKIRQVYGCTEIGAMGCTPPEDMSMERPTTVGFPQMTLKVRVVAENGQECGPGEIGELWAKGPQVMKGYWRNPEATEKAFVGGYYRTGDLVTRDADGTLTVVDRLKNMIISGGVNVYPAEIERAMAAIPGLEECGVFGMPDGDWGERVVAIVHGRDLPDPGSLKAQARDLLGPLKSPRELVYSPEPLPKTVTNKIARHELPALHATLTAVPASAA